jgi:uncharacterized protein with von Willebrand factor type A (vWA) domain
MFPANSIVQFCRFVRENGVGAGTRQTIECLEAAGAVAGADRNTFRFAWRAILCSSEDEWVFFEELFSAFWGESDPVPGTQSRKPNRRRLTSPGREGNAAAQTASGYGNGSALEGEGERKTYSGASAVERLKKVDFSQMTQADLEELERVATRLLRRMSYRVARRLRVRKCRETIDLRRTIRKNVSRGGELVDLCYKGPKKEQPKLVILLDVSDSMNPYSFFLLKFAYVLGKQSKDVKTYIFNTVLVEITGLLRARQISNALQMLSETTMGWSGGTKIGGSLREFNSRYAALLSRQTVFIMLSDGWDTGEPEELAAEMKKVRSRVAKLIWLNPLLGLDDYQPVTRGMSAALPFIDVFAAAHNLHSLLALEEHLRPGR